MLPILSLFGLALASIFVPDAQDDTDTRTDHNADHVSDQMAVAQSSDAVDASPLDSALGPEFAATDPSESAVLTGTSDTDEIWGHGGDDMLSGGMGADTLHGGAGHDILFGDDDAEGDELHGGDGHDKIYAATDDRVSGGDGDDVFNLSTDAAAYVADFNPDDDRVEVVYDKSLPAPELTTQGSDDGVHLFADGELVALFGGVSELDVETVALIAA